MAAETTTTMAAAQKERDWSSLPADLLRLVLARLPWSTHPSFGAACRHWRSVVAPFYPAWVAPVLLSAADVGSTNLRFYSPYYHKNFEVSRTLEAPGAKFCCAAGRHLTLCQRSKVLEADIVTGDVHELPPSIYGWFHFVVYDGGAETERMFGIHTIGHPRTAVIVKDDDGEWDDWDYALFPDSEFMEASPNTNPVLHGGSLYVLFDDGKLAVYDASLHSDDGLFKILDKPSSFGIHKCDEQPENKYLFESDDGELMAVLIGRRGSTVRIVKLDKQEMEWQEVENLGGRSLFTGTLDTMISKTKVVWMQNKVFLPRLYQWPGTVHVDIVERHGELAFVPTSTGGAGVDTKLVKDGANIWSHQLGSEESTEFWDTEKLDYSIWVDFNMQINK